MSTVLIFRFLWIRMNATSPNWWIYDRNSTIILWSCQKKEKLTKDIIYIFSNIHVLTLTQQNFFASNWYPNILWNMHAYWNCVNIRWVHLALSWPSVTLFLTLTVQIHNAIWVIIPTVPLKSSPDLPPFEGVLLGVKKLVPSPHS